MRVFNFEQWASSPSVATDAGRFVGIAIGPESDEAIVRVGGLLLQAGRPLTVRSDGGAYSIERVGAPANAIPSIARLQVVTFECLEEVEAFGCRANGRYGASSALTALGGWQRLATAPFVGRRQARFQLVTAAAGIDYRIIGLAYNSGARAVKESLLETVTGAVPDAGGTVAFYMGGSNEGECWDALALEVTPSIDDVVSVDVATIGELGAR